MPLPDEVFTFFAAFIESELGIVYSATNAFQLESRLEEIARYLGLPTVLSVYERAQGGINGPFKQLLLDVATNNETYFFRDPTIYKAIEKLVLPAFSKCEEQGETLQIWSAASSTGQEALSLAILISEWNAREKKDLKFSIVASDISTRVLEKARNGLYSSFEVQRGLPAPLMVKYFSQTQDKQWKASESLLKNIQHQSMNLLSPFLFPQRFHLVLCRNVLIYQSIERKKDIVSNIASTLVPGGFLVMGAGETLYGLSSAFDHAQADGTILYQKKSILGALAA